MSMSLFHLGAVLAVGARSVECHNACARCGADAGKECQDSGGSRMVKPCPDRLSGDPVLAEALRAMSAEAIALNGRG